jgi:hypothetical protein
MAFDIKLWFNKPGSGTNLDAPDEASRTKLDAAALRDLEARLSAYADTRPGPAGAQGAAGAQGPAGPPSVVVQQAAPDPDDLPVNTLWVETDGAVPPTIVALHVVVAA